MILEMVHNAVTIMDNSNEHIAANTLHNMNVHDIIFYIKDPQHALAIY